MVAVVVVAVVVGTKFLVETGAVINMVVEVLVIDVRVTQNKKNKHAQK